MGNDEEKSNWKIAIIGFALLLIVFLLLGLLMIKFTNETYQSHNLCISKGYDSNAFGGLYSEKFGLVKCSSCYDGECKYKEFRVYETPMGRLKEK